MAKMRNSLKSVMKPKKGETAALVQSDVFCGTCQFQEMADVRDSCTCQEGPHVPGR